MNQNLCNLLSNIKNGQKSNKKSIVQKNSGLCNNVLNLLWNEGLISGYRTLNTNKNYLEIFLKYLNNNEPAISNITNVSKPNKYIYYSIKTIWKFDVKLGTLVLSTNKGILTLEKSKKAKIGGKALFIIK